MGGSWTAGTRDGRWHAGIYAKTSEAKELFTPNHRLPSGHTGTRPHGREHKPLHPPSSAATPQHTTHDRGLLIGCFDALPPSQPRPNQHRVLQSTHHTPHCRRLLLGRCDALPPHLPIALEFGQTGRVHIEIPLLRLLSRPVRISIQGVALKLQVQSLQSALEAVPEPLVLYTEKSIRWSSAMSMNQMPKPLL